MHLTFASPTKFLSCAGEKVKEIKCWKDLWLYQSSCFSWGYVLCVLKKLAYLFLLLVLPNSYVQV